MPIDRIRLPRLRDRIMSPEAAAELFADAEVRARTVRYLGEPAHPVAGPNRAALLAAIAGIMWASNYGTVQHTMGFLPGLKAFTAAVFGGIGNLTGAVVGGLLLGLIESIGSGYIGDLTGGVLGSHYTDIFAFIVLIIILTLRPSGLLGERVADRA